MDFIGIYPDSVSKEFCDEVINYFDIADEQGFTFNRQEVEEVKKTSKDDNSITNTLAIHNSDKSHPLGRMIPYMGEMLNEALFTKFSEYSSIFDVLVTVGTTAPLNNYQCKCQKTKVGGGYHIWHYESVNRDTCSRVLFYTLYLNDVVEGGETEFLYQHKRIKPKRGTLILAPTGFTHTHRGNPPLSNEKYILTGWLEY